MILPVLLGTASSFEKTVSDISPEKETLVLSHEVKYRWENNSQILRIYKLGRDILIPTSNISYIEVWDPNFFNGPREVP